MTNMNANDAAERADRKPILAYRDPTNRKGLFERAWITRSALAFALATGCFSFLVFGMTGWIRFARAGSLMYGPQDQYVDLFNSIGALVSGAGLTIVGGGIFAAMLLIGGRATGEPSGNEWVWGMVAAVLYVLVFSLAVRAAEFIWGANVGGPTEGELAVHFGVGVAYPLVAGWVMPRLLGKLKRER